MVILDGTLTVEDHGQLIAFDWSSLLTVAKGVESVLEHGFFLFLLVCHEVFLLFHVAVVISNLSSASINNKIKTKVVKSCLIEG